MPHVARPLQGLGEGPRALLAHRLQRKSTVSSADLPPSAAANTYAHSYVVQLPRSCKTTIDATPQSYAPGWRDQGMTKQARFFLGRTRALQGKGMEIGVLCNVHSSLVIDTWL